MEIEISGKEVFSVHSTHNVCKKSSTNGGVI